MTGSVLPAILAALAILAAAEARAQACADDKLTRVAANGHCIAIRTAPPPEGRAENLAVFIHGDQSDGGPVSSMVSLALDIEVPPGTVKVALLRPGYYDREGNTSSGENHGRADSYTPLAIDTVAAAIRALKEHYKPSRTAIVGHSGGAAITGMMIGRFPGIAESALLLACPCDIQRWRSGRSTWGRSLSPHSFAGNVPATTRVLALTGASDSNTWGGLAENYVNLLKPRGIAAEYRTVPGADHNRVVRAGTVAPALAELLK